MTTRPGPPTSRLRGWIARWRAILPLLVAEFVVLVGFGALLPVLPLYVVDQGIDTATLGLIIAAWPIAKLGSEPIFGVLADRGGRKPLMITALILMSVFMILPLFFHDAIALFVLRFLAGVTAGMYDPAARGIIVDATEEGERGEAFGLYSGAAMGGLVFGPIIGSAGASIGGGFGFPFVLTTALLLVAAVFLWRQMSSTIPAPARHGHGPVPMLTERPGGQELRTAWAPLPPESSSGGPVAQAPFRALLNRPLLAAVAMNLGMYCAVGVYDVIWVLYMQHLRASLEWIGLTFTLFGLPVLILSPFAGRIVDRGGPVRYAAVGGAIVGLCGIGYVFATEPVTPALIGFIEATSFAFSGPALYALVAVGTPSGRSSTAQGLFGAAGTIGTIGAALLAGVLWAMDISYPFYLVAVTSIVSVVVGVLVARGRRSVSAVPSSSSLASGA
jgi:DHA1 family multidrug resistance protein-like MFS transporter